MKMEASRARAENRRVLQEINDLKDESEKAKKRKRECSVSFVYVLK